VLGGVVYTVGHSVGHHLAGPSLPKHCATPTYHLSNAATPAPSVGPHPASGATTSTSQRHHLAFALPSGWQPESSEDVLDGYEDRCGTPEIVLSGVAKYGTGYCAAAPRDYRAIAGVRGAEGEHDLAAVAREAASAWATWAYAGKGDEQPRVVASRARPISLRGAHGSLVRATSRSTVPMECGSAGGVVYAVALDSAAGADVFVIAANQGDPGDPGDPSEAALLAVAASVHRVA
jgi:hypothetical protein